MAKRPPRKRRLNKGTPFDFLADMVSDLIDRTLERAETAADTPPNFVWIFRCPNCATTIQVISATGPTRFIMCPSCGWNVPQPGTFVPPRQTAPPPPPRPPSRRRKDYYVTLGLRSNATADEIKTAYRRLALECHPDRKPGDAGAVERFKEIAEAYETLGNPEKRRVYDFSG